MAGDEGEHRPARDRKPELLADILGVGVLALPIAGAERLRKLRAESRVPAFIDAVEDARELRGVRAHAQQTFQPAAELGRGDLPRIGRADRGQVRGVDDAALEEGELVVEFDAIDVKRTFRRTDPPQRLPREKSLIGEVVNGEDRGDFRAAPGEIGRYQGGLPVIGVDQIGCPILVQSARGKFGGGRCQTAETDVVVGPVAAGLVAIGVARPIVKLRTQQDVDRQAVPRRRSPEPARRHLGARGTLANDLNMRELFDDVGIAG